MAARKAAARPAPADDTAAEAPVEPPQAAAPDHPGFVGDSPDETPNEHYTLSGVLAGLPVPEHNRPTR